MGILDLLPGVLKAAGKLLGIGDKVQEVVTALDGAPPEIRAQLAKDLQVHEQAMKALSIDELRTVMSTELAMIASPDKYVARARPTMLYVAGLITAAMACGMLAGVKLDTGGVVTLLGPLWGNAAWYTWNRTKEKMNGNGAHD